MSTPKDVLAMAKAEGVEIVDLRFSDLPGLMQHFSIPVAELTEDSFEDGLGFDGSSIRGFQEIQESDMLLVPDATTAYLDPFTKHQTLNLHCFVKDPVTGEMYTRDPRFIARKAELYLQQTGIGHLVLGPGGRVLHLRLRPLRPEPVRGLLPPRRGRGCVELGPRPGALR